MGKQIITLNLGQAGCNIGFQTIKQYVSEAEGNAEMEGLGFNNCFFDEMKTQGDPQWKARSMFIDSDPTTIEELQSDESVTKPYLPPDDCFYSLNTSSATFEKGNVSLDRFNEKSQRMQDELVAAKINKMVEACPRLDGVIFNYALSGGLGSGLACRLMEDDLFHKRDVLAFQVWPSNSFGSGPVGLINTTFALGKQFHTEAGKRPDVNVVVDNEALAYNLRKGGIPYAGLPDINQMIALVHSSITAPFRSEVFGAAGQGLASFRDNVCAGDLNIVTAAYLPIQAKIDESAEAGSAEGPPSVDDLVRGAGDPENCFIRYKVDGVEDVDPKYHEFRNVLFRARGLTVNKKGNPTKLCNPLMKVAIRNGIKKGYINMAPQRKWNAVGEGLPAAVVLPPASQFCQPQADLTMFGNNPAIVHVMKHRILTRAQKIWDSEAYQDHFSLMEASFRFTDCVEAIQDVVAKYEDTLTG